MKTKPRKMTLREASNHAAVFTSMAYLKAVAELLRVVYGWPDEQAAVFVTQLGEKASALAACLARPEEASDEEAG